MVVLAVSIPGIAAAERAPRSALARWDEAHAAWERGDLDAARALFETSHAELPRGRTACDLGRLLIEGGHEAEAAEWFRSCSEDSGVPQAERLEAAGRARFLTHSVGTLRLECDGAGVNVIVGAEPAGQCPLRLELTLPPGYHTVVTATADHGRSSRQVEVVPAGERSLRLEAPPSTPPPTRRAASAWAAWTMLGLGAALAAGTGAGAYFVRDAWSGYWTGASDHLDPMPLIASSITAALAGLALAAAVTLTPYTLVPHPRSGT